MKNQYFGDINDYRKYGLLRSIIKATELPILVAWMLTPDDGRTDGKFVTYLENPNKWAHYDPILHQTLKHLLANNEKRLVSLIHDTGLLPGADYFSSPVSDFASARDEWFSFLNQRAQGSAFVFLDPDNGLEVKSTPYGKKDSSKFLYWREVESLWASGKSLLIYQHFTRQKRHNFILGLLENLKTVTPGSTVDAFSTPHVVFLMGLAP